MEGGVEKEEAGEKRANVREWVEGRDDDVKRNKTEKRKKKLSISGLKQGKLKGDDAP